MEKSTEGEEFKPSYKVIIPTEEEKQKCIFLTHEDKIREAERLKTEGNLFFKQKEFKKAFSCYHKVFFMINGIIDPHDEISRYSLKNSEVATLEILEKVKELKFSVFLNMSQIDIMNKNYGKAVERASESLKIKKSIKGFYRRGIAYIEINEFEKARKDLETVREMDLASGNTLTADLEEKFLLIKQREKAFDKELRGKFKNMFK